MKIKPTRLEQRDVLRTLNEICQQMKKYEDYSRHSCLFEHVLYSAIAKKHRDAIEEILSDWALPLLSTWRYYLLRRKLVEVYKRRKNEKL